MVNIWRKLFPVRVEIRHVPVFDGSATKDARKAMDELLPLMVDCGRTSQDLMQYELLRLQDLHEELFRIQQPSSVDESVKYSIAVSAILARQDEVKRILSIPSRAIKALDKKGAK